MNSLGDLRKFFQDNKIEVKEFTGFSMTADSASWGIAFETPIRDGLALSPEAWKEYAKGIKSRVVTVTS
jgi:hypothetical protein